MHFTSAKSLPLILLLLKHKIKTEKYNLHNIGFVDRKPDFVACKHKGKDQHVHQYSMISAFTISSLE